MPKDQPGRCSANALPALSFPGTSPKALASPSWQSQFCPQQEKEDGNNPRVAKREVGAQGTNKCEGISTVCVSWTAYTEPGKAGTGEPSYHPGGPGEDSALASGVGSRERRKLHQGSTTLLHTAKNRRERAEKNKGSRLWRRPNKLMLTAMSHFRGLGSPVMALEWDTVSTCEAAEGTAPS